MLAVMVIGGTIVALGSRGDEPSDPSAGQAAGSRSPAGAGSVPSSGGQAPRAGGGKELTVLAGRLVVAAPLGWEALESSDETVTIKLALREQAGRELLATLIIVTLPSAGSLDTTLRVQGGTPFELEAAGGPVRATAVEGAAARIVAGIVRPRATFFLSLSIFALDGRQIDLALLRKLFTEQVVPTLRFP